ncbi:phosphatidylethanolamine N-methyltransferase isoform X5 [Ailuropoda melanoleuca]|uniref:phosphatidylethanolamine N-methyltransferase isoform X5 n=1 Tax=Ailuropoda melanoleuca TaxID=9646 RepID=UPI001493F97B|nr:phosphatidylethanolamine N-methyltransferase isoform X5 [Ailuropoda melanoleuca]
MPWRAPGQPRLAGTGNYISQKAERAWGHRESAPCGTASRYDRAALGDESAAARPRRRPSRGGPAQGTWRPGAEPMSSSVAGPDCCGGLGNVDFRQADLCVMTRLLGYVDPSDPCFVAAVLAITFNPLFWNVVLLKHLLTLPRSIDIQSWSARAPFAGPSWRPAPRTSAGRAPHLLERVPAPLAILKGRWSATDFLHLHCPGLLCAFQLPPARPHQNEDEQHRYHQKVCHTPDVSSEHLCA